MIGEGKRIIREVAGTGLNDLHGFDTVPVVFGAREAASLVYFMANGLKGLPYGKAMGKMRGDGVYQAFSSWAQERGMETDVCLEPQSRSELLVKFHIYRKGRENGDCSGEIGNRFRQAVGEVRKGAVTDNYREGLRLEGEFLGYPRCCVNKFVDETAEEMAALLKKGKAGKRERRKRPVGRRILSQLRSYLGEWNGEPGHVCVARIKESVPSEVLLSNFAATFYPCEFGCRDAVRVGKSILGAYRQRDPEMAEYYESYILPMALAGSWSTFSDMVKEADGREPVFKQQLQAAAAFESLIRGLGGMFAEGPGVSRKIGPNKPCPCGSGRKFKRCCGRC